MAKNKNNANKSNAKNKANPDTQGIEQRDHKPQGVNQENLGTYR